MPKTALIKQLEGILNPDEVNAFSAKLELLVEEKADERATVILEEERVLMKEKLAKSADDFVKSEITKQVGEAKGEFDSLLQEAKENYETRLVEEIKVLEENLVPKIDALLEEQVNTILPEEIQSKVAKADLYEPIIAGSRKLFEEHLVPVEADADAQISKIKTDVIQLNEELETVTTDAESARTELEATKKSLLLEQRGVHLTETQKTSVLELFEESTYDMMHERVDNAITMLEEQNGLGKGSEEEKENKDADIAPDTSIDDSGKASVLEEEKKVETSVEAPLNNFKKSIDDLL